MAPNTFKKMVVQDRALVAANGVLILANGPKNIRVSLGGNRFSVPEDGAIVIWPADFRLKLGPCALTRGWIG